MSIEQTALGAGGGGSAINDDGTLSASVNSSQHCVHIVAMGSMGLRKVVVGTPGVAGHADGSLRSPHFACFTRRGGVDTLLICDAGNDRVVEVAVDGAFLRSIALIRDACPYGVAYCSQRDLIAVSLYAADMVLLLSYDAVAPPVVTIGTGRSGRRDGQLDGPRGLHFTLDGAQLLLADTWNHRVSKFCVGTGVLLSHVATHISRPSDVIQCGDGTIVIVGSETVMRVGLEGEKVEEGGGGGDDDDGDGGSIPMDAMFTPWSLSYSPASKAVVIKEYGTEGRVVTLKDGSLRCVWPY